MTQKTDDLDDDSSAGHLVLTLVDLTSLGDDDTESDVVELCQKAMSAPALIASVCVWPRFVELAVEELKRTEIPVCAVANFPLGQNDPEIAISDALAITTAGGSEVDVVVPWQAIRDGQSGVARRLVAGVRQAVGAGPVIKAILETGELSDPDLIRIAGTEAIAGGADFLKTSTGKTTHSATPAAARVLLELIRDHKAATGISVGLKISGGVRTLDQALVYLEIAESVMGAEWIDPSTFRFGASSLLEDVVKTLQ